MNRLLRRIVLFALSILPGFIKIAGYRLLGYDIDHRVKIGFCTLLDINKHAKIGFACSIGSFCFIKAETLNMESYAKIASVVFLQVPMVKIGRDSLISHAVVIRSGHTNHRSALVLGDLVHIFPYVNIDCTNRVEIKTEAGIGPKCDIYTHSSYKSVLEGYPVTYADVLIGERVELTYSVFVAPGVTIGDDGACAFGSYVNRDVPAGVLVAGMPAVEKRTREQIAPKPSATEVSALLADIVEKCGTHIQNMGKRQEVRIKLVETADFHIEDNTIYVVNIVNADRLNIAHYGIFNINTHTCYNCGIDKSQFREARKFFSRYGIRFVTSLDIK